MISGLAAEAATGLRSSNFVALKAAISGSIFDFPAVSLVISTAFPFCSAFALPTHQVVSPEPLFPRVPSSNLHPIPPTAADRRTPGLNAPSCRSHAARERQDSERKD